MAHEDILPLILTKTVPEVAKELLSSTAHAMTVQKRIGEQDVIITSDPAVAKHIFDQNGKNYRQRMGNDAGLKNLGMLNAGVIWNNDATWKEIRKVFDKSLHQSFIARAEEVARWEALRLVEEAVSAAKEEDEGGVQMLLIMRKVTFRVTMQIFFGLDVEGFVDIGMDEEDVISSIVNYFKAWEYFLFRPAEAQYHKDSKLDDKHMLAIKELKTKVSQILVGIRKTRGRADPKRGAVDEGNKRKIFIDILLDQADADQLNEEMLEQTALEMLLAGTDTSSVTAYYCVLGLAEMDCSDFQERLFHAANSEGAGELFDGLIYETLRFKPVGPIIIRQAVNDDMCGDMEIKAGTGVIIHVALMNILDCFWQQPEQFMPERTDFVKNMGKEQPCFFPFGKGPKACVGQHLGMAEVKAILSTLVPRYQFVCPQEPSPLKTLETRWDIANQPADPLKVQCIPRQ